MRARPVLVGALLLALAGCSGAPGTERPDDRPAADRPPVALDGPPSEGCTAAPTVEVTDGGQLAEALAGARPGDVVGLAPGTYGGPFVATTPGTADAPIVLCGPREAVLDGGPLDGDYALHLDGASHWQLSGFTVRGGQKGVMVDAATGVLVSGLLVEGVGDEGIHLRRASSDNVVRGNTVRRTGLRKAKFGEGIYVGSAESNWCDISACGPDRSDRNLVEGNVVSETTAEAVDVKEGTTGGTLRGNTFSGAGLTEADSWVDVKGNGWTIEANTGTDSRKDGFQVHEILDGWGVDNVFSGNVAVVNADGYAVNVTKNEERNRVSCDNRSTGAAQGLAKGTCT